MVSTHKVPVFVYLIIKVICFAFRFKRGNLACCPSHESRPSHCPTVRTDNAESPRMVYLNPMRERIEIYNVYIYDNPRQGIIYLP